VAELRITGDALELFDMDRGERIVLHETLADQNRIFEVVSRPGHERDEDVPAERKLAHIGRLSVGDHFTALDEVPYPHDRTLVDAGVLVRTLVFDQVVDIDARVQGIAGQLVGLDHDSRPIYRLDESRALRYDGGAGIAGHDPLDACADERSRCPEEGH